MRFIAEAELKAFDPIWNTAYITRNHGYLVYDTLFGTDADGQIKPQMVDRTTVSSDGITYTFTLRDGLLWHDGRAVTSEDCVESLKRQMRQRAPLASAPQRPEIRTTHVVVRDQPTLRAFEHDQAGSSIMHRPARLRELRAF